MSVLSAGYLGGLKPSAEDPLTPHLVRARSSALNSLTGTESRSWIVRSVLPPSLRAMMATDVEALAKETAKEEYGAAVQGKREGEAVLMDWRSADNAAGNMGLLYVVLALILVNGRSMSDGECSAEWGGYTSYRSSDG